MFDRIQPQNYYIYQSDYERIFVIQSTDSSSGSFFDCSCDRSL
uniref:DPPIV_N domain-containing protein n=1 Tax=Schistosoma curassoni TaxID=6186 RepID=A0A183KHF3_9TREM